MKSFPFELYCIAGYSKNTPNQMLIPGNLPFSEESRDNEINCGYSCIFDWPNMRYTYISTSIKKILGYEKEQFYKQGLDFSLSIIHPEDLGRLKEIHLAIFNYYYSTPTELRTRLRFSYNFRAKAADESYVHLLRQSTFIGFTDDGKPALEQINSIDITGFSYNSGITLVVHQLSAGGTYALCYEHTFPFGQLLLSERENQVMKLVGQGYTTKEIAKKLYLSMETIKSHRKKIIAKTGALNMTAALHAMHFKKDS